MVQRLLAGERVFWYRTPVYFVISAAISAAWPVLLWAGAQYIDSVFFARIASQDWTEQAGGAKAWRNCRS